MDDYKKEKKGVLFDNNKTTEHQPDMTGSIVFDGKEYRLACWKNISKSGLPYLSIKASLPDPKYQKKTDQKYDYQKQQAQDEQQQQNTELFDEDIPF